MSDQAISRKAAPQRGSLREVFTVFLKLGLTSFGGPIAHLGYFHRELIQRLQWIDEARYAQLVALCQFLPGPASSQLGFSLGLIRAGWTGAIAAFIAFTLPSAFLLLAFAQALPFLEQPYGRAAIHGLKLVAVAVVAHGVLAMAKRLTPDMPRRFIAVIATIAVVIHGTALMQLVTIAAGALLGLCLCRKIEMERGANFEIPYGKRIGAILLTVFGTLLAAILTWENPASPLTSVASSFYRAGALVFGGGHVVLPLLEQAIVVPGWITIDEFLAGYGAAQAAPGPLFSVAAFFGARLNPGGGMLGATVALLAIFLPGFLLVGGVLPYWQAITEHRGTVSALAGVNAAVVGLLAGALYNPVWTQAVFTFSDFVIAALAFILLTTTRLSVLIVLAGCVLASLARRAPSF